MHKGGYERRADEPDLRAYDIDRVWATFHGVSPRAANLVF